MRRQYHRLAAVDRSKTTCITTEANRKTDRCAQRSDAQLGIGDLIVLRHRSMPVRLSIVTAHLVEYTHLNAPQTATTAAVSKSTHCTGVRRHETTSRETSTRIMRNKEICYSVHANSPSTCLAYLIQTYKKILGSLRSRRAAYATL
jgi:hypothetical protein